MNWFSLTKRFTFPRWPLRLVRVEGESMLPTLEPGDVLLLMTPRGGLPKLGSLVEVLDPRDQRPLIKRVTQVEASRYWVEGDNPCASRDSRAFGALGEGEYVGRALLRLRAAPLSLRRV